jgi:integrase
MSRKSEGSIYQVKDGGWKGAISLGYVDGKLKRKVVKRKTHAAVAEELRKLLTKRDKNQPISTTRRTVAQFMQEWLEVHVKPNLGPNTYCAYEQVVRLHIVPMLGRLRLDQLNGAEVQQCLNACQLEKGLSPKSVKNVNGTLKSALSTAKKWRYIEGQNVAKDATPPKQKKFKAKPLTVEHADKLLSWLGATYHRFEALFYLALMMGFRRGELLGLQWPDIDFSRGVIHIQHNCQWSKKKGMVLTCVKSEDSDAAVPVPSLCAAALRRRQLIQEQERITAGDKWVKDLDFVFTSSHGRRLAGDVPLRELKHALALNSLADIRLHDLRHTTASLLLAKRTPMKVIQAIMRHASFQITMDLYSHLAPTELRDTADVMNGIFTDMSSQKIGNATHGATLPSPERVQ